MKRLKPELVESILCLGAHCDDIEIGCGGAILTLLAEHPGASVHWIVFSSTPERAPEATACAQRFLGAARSRTVEVLDYRDGFFPWSGGEIKEYFESLKSEIDPDLIFTHYRDDLHQDHRLICELTWNTFRDHTILEYEIPKWDGDLGRPNLYVPLSEDAVARKIGAIMESFASQHGKQWFDEETFRSLMRLRGLEANAAERYAEAFYARKLSL
jgi:LmbE family N-acetylglucosaminyl deacetylase